MKATFALKPTNLGNRVECVFYNFKCNKLKVVIEVIKSLDINKLKAAHFKAYTRLKKVVKPLKYYQNLNN